MDQWIVLLNDSMISCDVCGEKTYILVYRPCDSFREGEWEAGRLFVWCIDCFGGF